MQFRKRDKERIARGEITMTFRVWKRPLAKAGGRYRVGEQMIEVSSVEQIKPAQISAEDARAAGHDSPADALLEVGRYQKPDADPDAPLYRIAFQHIGQHEDPRSVLAADTNINAQQLDEITDRLSRMDSRSKRGPWTQATLKAIADNPGVRAGDLAEAAGLDLKPFKSDVRKLKALGLTISLEVGYELSPRGRVVLDALES